MYSPGNHSVTQSTFADPCDLAPGGFDSGWVFIPPTPALSDTPEWNLTITDDTKRESYPFKWNSIQLTIDSSAIWFFCKQMRNPAHCPSGEILRVPKFLDVTHMVAGMVGSINAPTSGNTFDAFLANAKAFSSTPGVCNLHLPMSKI